MPVDTGRLTFGLNILHKFIQQNFNTVPAKKLIATCFLFVIVLASNRLYAQNIENSINLYGINFPQEKIHIHFDKESYLPGETIWFKAYLFEDNLPSERSTNFYAAIYDDKGKLIKQQISPVFMGSTDGHFDIPDTLSSGQLICRAYTSWMLNFDTTMLYSQSIKLVNVNNNDKAPAINKTVNLGFYPEGGDIIEGTVNTVAFKANYNNGLPFFINGAIKNQESGEVLLPLVTEHEGMGKFNIDVQPGNKYYAEWFDNNGVKHQTWLPEAKRAGVSLKLTIQKDKLYYNLVNKTGNDSLHILMYMYQKVFYRSNLKIVNAEPYTGMVPVNSLPTGIMQLTVFDANWQPVAERVAFINNNNFIADVAVNATSISIAKRGKNNLVILVSDTIPVNMSLSITDADMNGEASENTILSDLLLKGDIRGYVHNPAFYFSSNTDAALKNKLDLVMLTHGWRRYNWADMLANKMPAIRMPADNYLGVYGQIEKGTTEKMEKDERVNLILKKIDSTNTFYSLVPDQNGILKQTGLIFYDTAKIYFSFNKNKANNSRIGFSNYNFTYPVQKTLNSFQDYLLPDTAGTTQKPSASLFRYYAANGGIRKFNEEKTLGSVMVKTSWGRNWKNDPIVKMDEKYTSGLFTGGANVFALDVVHDEKAWTKFDFYSYIRNVIPGLIIGNADPVNGRSLKYIDRLVLVYIDEHEMTYVDLENLNLSQIAYIKFIGSFIGRGPENGGAAINPAISVYTRKGDDLIDRRPTEKDLGKAEIAGYTPVKEFYSPDYSQSNTGGTDARTTLLWMPYVLTDKANRKVPISFYNNDFTKRMRIVLEGINEEGKIIRIEKIVE